MLRVGLPIDNASREVRVECMRYQVPVPGKLRAIRISAPCILYLYPPDSIRTFILYAKYFKYLKVTHTVQSGRQ